MQDVRNDIFPVGDSIVSSSFRADHHVAKILCDLYSHLLDFYFRAVHLLQKGSVRNTAAVLWDEELMPLVTSFEEAWQRLDSLVQQENVVSNRFLIDGRLDEQGDPDGLTIASQKCVLLTRCTFNLVRTLLDVHREHESQNRIMFEHRVDKACDWITKVPAFQDWCSGRDPESLVLLGKLGCGKTFTIAYVVQYLRDGTSASSTPTTGIRSMTAASASQSGRNVYVYYCKDDGTAKQALNALRSLLSQLLRDHKNLRWHFHTWVQEQEEARRDPTFNPSCLSNLLITLVAMLPQPTFLIIDALDECLLSDRRVLLDVLEQVSGRRTSTRVLTPARASNFKDQSEPALYPENAKPICFWDLSAPWQRDLCIAEFLVKHHMSHVSEDKGVRKLLVETLTSKMEGCAIWARMALEYLVTAGLTSPGTIGFYLEKNALPGPLTELYLRIFENVTGECKWLLARSLELIPGTRRRLSFDELLCALSLYTPLSTDRVSRAKDLTELQDILLTQVGGGCIRKLLRPFAGLEPTVGFVHQSLKDAVLKFPKLTDAAPSRKHGWTGVSGIEGVMLRSCVDYLLLDDFNWTETIPGSEKDYPQMSQVHQKM